jgi:hypothetical protein
MREDGGRRMLWFIAGVGAGVAAGLLLAPASGADSRRYLGRRVAGAGQECYGKGRDLYQRGCRLADEAAALFDEGRRIIEAEAAAAERDFTESEAGWNGIAR